MQTSPQAQTAPKAILFDLDGTLADTAPDLGEALNLVLQEEGRAPLSEAQTRPFASHGARGLLQAGFGIDDKHPAFESLRTRFLAHYDHCFAHHPRLFAGANTLLEKLVASGLQWGIITNKHSRFTDKLVPLLGFSTQPAVVVSGDTTAAPKPDPRPMLHACNSLGLRPADCWYVGDAERDIQAGHAVGMTTVLAEYGYLLAADQPSTWGADYHIAALPDLLAIIETKLAQSNLSKPNLSATY